MPGEAAGSATKTMHCRKKAQEKFAQAGGAAYPVKMPEAGSKTLSSCPVFPVPSTDNASVLADQKKNT